MYATWPNGSPNTDTEQKENISNSTIMIPCTYIFNCKCRSISMYAPWPNGSPNTDTDTDTKENYSKFNNLVR